MREQYDIAFLGGGPAGYQGAIRAAQLGARVAVVEEKFVGGVCLNWGCIPTKAVRASAEAGRSMRRAQGVWIQAGGGRTRHCRYHRPEAAGGEQLCAEASSNCFRPERSI